jgi:hypothetical protein
MGYGFGPSDTKPGHDKPKKPVFNKPGVITCPYCGNKLSLKDYGDYGPYGPYGPFGPGPGFGPFGPFGPGYGPGGYKK